MEQYAIYLRKSREDKEAEAAGRGETLARHEQLLLETARQQGLTIGAIYREIVSGETIAARPEMLRLLADVGAGKWSGVLVTEVPRLARGNTSDQGLVVEAFSRSGALIITPQETIDPNNEIDEDRLDLSLFMSRFEYKFIKRRMMRGRAASLNDGKYLCPTPPYGYKRIKLAREKGWSLEIIPREAEVVRLVFQKYVQEQESLSAIAAQLNAMGIAARKGGPWQPNTLRQMLKNPIYDGKIWWGKRNPTKRDNKPPTILPGRHEAILSPNLYEEAQKRFGAQPPPPTKALQNPLAGLIYCADCGKAMLRLPHAKGERPDQLYCRTKSCANVASYLHIVEQKTLAALENWVAAYSLDLTNQNPGDSESQQQRIIAQSLAALEQEVKAKQEQLDNTYNLLEQGLYTPALFEERQKILTAQIAVAEKQRRELRAKLAELTKAPAIWEAPKPLWPESQPALACYSQLKDAKAKNELLKVIIGKIEYKKTPDHQGPDDFTLKIYPRVPRI